MTLSSKRKKRIATIDRSFPAERDEDVLKEHGYKRNQCWYDLHNVMGPLNVRRTENVSVSINNKSVPESECFESCPNSLTYSTKVSSRPIRRKCFGVPKTLILVLFLVILTFEFSYNVAEAADDDGNGDDRNDLYYDDYYDDDNINNGNNNGGDDDFYDYHNAADDALRALDDYYQTHDDYVNIMERENFSFDQVTFMPISCIQYNNGHMVKFELFESANNYQCHFKNLGTYVVSIAHFMRAYFNQQALIEGNEFNLPGDAGYLNCVMLQQTAYSNEKLYAKIGCMDRETFTSTKLQLHVYTDKKCTERYQDGQSDRYHSSKGYEINGYTFSTRTTFRPPFYSCQTCTPYQVSETFMKKSYWYDDDYISQYGQKRNANNDDNDDAGNDDSDDDANDQADDANDDAADDANGANDDDNYDDKNDQALDDAVYFAANDDGDDYGADDGGQVVANDDDFYKYQDDKNDDGGKRRNRRKRRDKENRRLVKGTRCLTAAFGELQKYEKDFWKDIEHMQRSLNNDDGIGDWNVCDRIYKYGIWCDSNCRAIDTFRVDEWSKSDVFLLVIMCVFMAAMMLLIFAKRIKAYERARIFDDETETRYPGLPPMAMVLLFILIIAIILTLAKFKFVNETLVFAVVQCILLFIYMLKLTLFERQTPSHLLSTRRKQHTGMNSMNRHLFDS